MIIIILIIVLKMYDTLTLHSQFLMKCLEVEPLRLIHFCLDILILFDIQSL